jgi:formylglycine-generating enzyme required for sulfatase activity
MHILKGCNFMKKSFPYFLTLMIVILFSFNLKSNNIQIYNVEIIEKNTTEHWAHIRFNLSFDNAWRINTGASNWCAAWIFLKYRLADNIVHHATLSNINTHHMMPGNVTGDPSMDGKGIFIYDSRENIENYNFSANGIILRWDYGADGVSDTASYVDIKVLGIEMVYIPQGAFYLGSGGTEINAFYKRPVITNSYEIVSETDPIQVGPVSENLFYNNNSLTGGDWLGPIPADFPKGFDSFYMMRYEISQQQYVDFLNTLTRLQQISRVTSNISGTDIFNNFVMSGSTNMLNRNSISCPVSGNGTDGPVNFFCDYNENGVREPNDGQNIACGYLNWDDGLAYLDWAGLRPMTELEFEKSCRGPAVPVANEFVWGTLDLTMALIPILNSGQISEIVSNSGNGLSNFDNTELGIGPLRCGFASTSLTNNRLQAAATYYGLLNMGDNLSERCITVGSPEGRQYNGNHGDGSLTGAGGQDVISWPDISGQSVRTGNYLRPSNRMTVSERSFGYYSIDDRYENVGWRGVRTAE